MGRIVTYLTILIVMDLMFIVTGQLCAGGDSCTLTSAIFGIIMNPSLATLSSWFHGLIGDLGSLLSGNASPGQIGNLISTLIGAGGAIAVGSLVFGLKNDSILFAPTGVALSLLVVDFVNIYSYIAVSSPVLALFIFSPIIVIFVFTCLEWIRGMQ